MKTTRLLVKDLARLAGVSVRTLHHYDRIGLLEATGRTAAGYRYYDGAAALRLRRILVHRALGLTLPEVAAVVDGGPADTRAVLASQRDRLRDRIEELGKMLAATEEALAAAEGGAVMRAQELFKDFDGSRYEPEVEARWGGTEAYAESARRTAAYGESDWEEIRRESAEILAELAACLHAGTPADAAEPAALAERYRRHLDRWFYPLTPAGHVALAEMYEGDPRFRATFEEVREGLAGYLAGAIRANAAGDGGRRG